LPCPRVHSPIIAVWGLGFSIFALENLAVPEVASSLFYRAWTLKRIQPNRGLNENLVRLQNCLGFIGALLGLWCRPDFGRAMGPLFSRIERSFFASSSRDPRDQLLPEKLIGQLLAVRPWGGISRASSSWPATPALFLVFVLGWGLAHVIVLAPSVSSTS